MELIRIDEEKLKIILSHEDLMEFEIDESELDYANTETKRMFWELLRRAKLSTGFDTDGHRVLVQLYPSREGGCELFVTRLGILCHHCDFDDYGEDDDVNLAKHSRHSLYGEPQSAFGFDTLAPLLCVCRRLRALDYDGNSDVYHAEDGRYYLFLEDVSPTNSFSVDEFSFLHEYGTSEPTDTLRTHLLEHGSPVCLGNATSLLGVL
ncbi:MAG: adaptor protein MecA [Clostridia bacterium]|nr:adaptor protein MecA [Clostridia bacterium]